jgi:hypothetical protein
MIDYFSGKWCSAQKQFDLAGEIYRRSFASWTRYELDTSEYYAMCALAYQGKMAELARRLPLCRRNAEERGDQYFSCMLCVGETGLSWLVGDDPDGGRAAIVEQMARWSRKSFQTQHFFELQGLSLLDLYQGRGREALSRFDRSWPALRRSFILSVQVGRSMMHYLRACSALMAASAGDGQGRDVARLLDRAAADSRRLLDEQMPWVEPLGRVVESGIADHKHDGSGAIAALQQAIVGFDAADMSLWSAAAKRRLGVLIGGDRGRELQLEGTDALSREGVRRPERWTAMLVPGRER